MAIRNHTLALVTLALTASVAACSQGFIGGDEDGLTMGEAPVYDNADRTRGTPPAAQTGAPANAGAPSAPSFPECATAAGAVADEPPARLLCTGLYSDRTLITVGPGVDAYEPAYTLFSDHAIKSRWIHLPAGQRIDASNMDEWVFPVGTKLWKQFVLGGQRIETRFMWKVSATRWAKAVYRWSTDQRDAVRLDTGERISIGSQIGDASYEIPGIQKCDQCHSGRVDKVLGFEAVGLGIPGASGLTLDKLAASERLTVKPSATTLVVPADASGFAAPALGWMHSNCGLSCHNTSPGAFALGKGMDLRLTYAGLRPSNGSMPTVPSLASYRTTVGVAAGRPAGALARIVPGSAATSAIPMLASNRDALNPYAQMPPGLSHVVDEAGLSSLRNWINALP